jgi:hypothetical protein
MACIAFRGWVPTVSGALSFSAFGEVSHPPRALRANRTDGLIRYLICYRGRDYSDVLLPFKSVLGPRFLNLRGRLWFLCIASATTIEKRQETLEGFVFVFDDKHTWRTRAQPFVQEAQGRLQAFKYGPNGTDLRSYFGATHDRLIADLPSCSAFNARFSIARTGMTTIEIPDGMVVREAAPRLPNEEPRRTHITHIIAAQIFFFLRDIGHRHQHHDPNTDTIVDLHEADPNDELAWKLQTLYSLYRKIITYKRLKQADSLAASLGVVAYANTFRELVVEKMTSEERDRMPKFFSENVVGSISAIKDEMIRLGADRTVAQAVTRELILAALAIVIAVVGVFQITEYKVPKRPADVLYLLGELLTEYPATTLGSVVGLIFILRTILGVNNPARGRLFRWIVRLVQPFDLRVAIGMFFALGTIALSMMLLLLRFL